MVLLRMPRPPAFVLDAPGRSFRERAVQGLAEERQLWRSGVRVNLTGNRVVLPQQPSKED